MERKLTEEEKRFLQDNPNGKLNELPESLQELFKNNLDLAQAILNEGSGNAYKYNCAMLYFNFPEIDAVHEVIKEEDLYTVDDDFGIEDEPHCTLLFGLHPEVTTKEVEKVIDKYTFYPCKAHNPSLFENDDYDVLKFDIKGDNLEDINKDLKEYPYTSDFPDYHPHLTIAYLQPGKGKKYIKILKDAEADEFRLIPTHVMYSKVGDGEIKTKDKISINVD